VNERVEREERGEESDSFEAGISYVLSYPIYFHILFQYKYHESK
jgi:hypothetical protein